MICQEEMPAALAEAIRKSYEELGEKVGEKDPFVAVRSSATAETYQMLALLVNKIHI